MSSPIGFAIVVSAILAIIVILGAPFTMIIMGSLNLQDCPAKTYIPIFLIVSGKMLKVYPILHIFGCIRMKKQFLGLYGLLFYIDCILSFFLSKKRLASHQCLHFLIIIAMFFTGSVWVYRTSPDLQVLVDSS